MIILLFPYRMTLKSVILIFTPQEPTVYQMFPFKCPPNNSGFKPSTLDIPSACATHSHLPTASPSNQELNSSFVPSLILPLHSIYQDVHSIQSSYYVLIASPLIFFLMTHLFFRHHHFLP